MSTKRKPQLSRAQMFKVAAWINAHYNETKGKTKTEVLNWIKADTGITMPETTAADYFKDLGKAVPWAGTNGDRGGPMKHLSDRLSELAAQVLLLSDQVNVLAKSLGVDIEERNPVELDDGTIVETMVFDREVVKSIWNGSPLPDRSE